MSARWFSFLLTCVELYQPSLFFFPLFTDAALNPPARDGFGSTRLEGIGVMDLSASPLLSSARSKVSIVLEKRQWDVRGSFLLPGRLYGNPYSLPSPTRTSIIFVVTDDAARFMR